MDKKTKKEFEKQAKVFGRQDLTKHDEKKLKKSGFKIELIELFNWYRKAKSYIVCRPCDNILRKSVNLNKLKTTVKESQEYSLNNVCAFCKKRLEELIEK